GELGNFLLGIDEEIAESLVLLPHAGADIGKALDEMSAVVSALPPDVFGAGRISIAAKQLRQLVHDPSNPTDAMFLLGNFAVAAMVTK
ncbi:MAG: hypothetical protein ACREBP_03120, partial [Sphingomicrobium sp.]